MRGRRALTGVCVLAWSGAVSAGAAVAAGPAGAGARGPVSGGARAGVQAGVQAAGVADSAPVPQPVAGGPAQVTVPGKASGGIQASLTVPQQMPLDPPNQALTRRVITVGVANSTTSAYTGVLHVSLTALTSGSGTAVFPPTLQQLDAGTGTWQDVAIAADQGPTWSGTQAAFTIPAGQSAQESFRMSAGTVPLTGIKVTATLDGATAVTTIPVTGMTFTVSGLPGALQTGVAAALTGQLSNPTDVAYTGVGFAFSAQACGTGGGCIRAQDLDVEYQKGGVWSPVTLQTTAAGVVGTVDGALSVKAGGTVAVPLRLTVAATAVADGPIKVALQADGLPVPAVAAPQSVSVVPASTLSSGVRTDASSDATPSDDASSDTPSASDSSSLGAPVPTDGATATDTASATAELPAAAGSSGGASGMSPVVLAAGGALVLSVLLLGWYFVWHKQQRSRVAASAPVTQYPEYEDHMDHSGY